jgi:hypothetical protein
MTKSRERGESEITDEARREAARTKRPVAEILAEMLADAKAVQDRQRARKIRRAQKFLGSRNKRKRRSK